MLKRMNAKQQETGMDYLEMAQSVQALGDNSMNITLRCAASCTSAPPAPLHLLRLCTCTPLRLRTSFGPTSAPPRLRAQAVARGLCRGVSRACRHRACLKCWAGVAEASWHLACRPSRVPQIGA